MRSLIIMLLTTTCLYANPSRDLLEKAFHQPGRSGIVVQNHFGPERADGEQPVVQKITLEGQRSGKHSLWYKIEVHAEQGPDHQVHIANRRYAAMLSSPDGEDWELVALAKPGDPLWPQLRSNMADWQDDANNILRSTLVAMAEGTCEYDPPVEDGDKTIIVAHCRRDADTEDRTVTFTLRDGRVVRVENDRTYGLFDEDGSQRWYSKQRPDQPYAEFVLQDGGRFDKDRCYLPHYGWDEPEGYTRSLAVRWAGLTWVFAFVALLAGVYVLVDWRSKR